MEIPALKIGNIFRSPATTLEPCYSVHFQFAITAQDPIIFKARKDKNSTDERKYTLGYVNLVLPTWDYGSRYTTTNGTNANKQSPPCKLGTSRTPSITPNFTEFSHNTIKNDRDTLTQGQCG